jgi:uncharacterized RDD family membrane protein YckC
VGGHEDNVGIASPGRRLAGYLIDALIVGVVLAPVINTVEVGREQIGMVLQAGWLVAQMVLVTGATIGMRAVRLRAVEIATGRPPGPLRALVRWFVPGIPTAPALFLTGWVAAALSTLGIIAVYVGVFRRPRRQGLHDHASGVIIVRSR